MPVRFPNGEAIPTVEELEAHESYKELDDAGKLKAQQRYLRDFNRLGSMSEQWNPQMVQGVAERFKQVGVEEGFDWSWKPWELAGEAIASAPIVGDVTGRIIESGLNQADVGEAMLQARGQGDLRRQLAAMGTLPPEAQQQLASEAYGDAFGQLAREQQRQESVDPLMEKGDIFKKPISTIGKVAGQSLVSMLGGADKDAPVVGPLASLTTFAGPMAAGFRQEFPASVMEELKELGYDLSDPAVVERVLTDPTARADLEEAERVGKIRGGVIAAFDFAFQLAGGAVARGIGKGGVGVGRKAATEATEEAVGATLPKVSLEGGRSRLVSEGLGGLADSMKGRMAIEGAVELAADALGGGGGESAARALAGQEQDLEDILLEATGGLATQAPASALSVAGAEGIAQNEAQKQAQAEAFQTEMKERQQIIDTIQQYAPDLMEPVRDLLMVNDIAGAQAIANEVVAEYERVAVNPKDPKGTAKRQKASRAKVPWYSRFPKQEDPSQPIVDPSEGPQDPSPFVTELRRQEMEIRESLEQEGIDPFGEKADKHVAEQINEYIRQNAKDLRGVEAPRQITDDKAKAVAQEAVERQRRDRIEQLRREPQVEYEGTGALVPTGRDPKKEMYAREDVATTQRALEGVQEAVLPSEQEVQKAQERYAEILQGETDKRKRMATRKRDAEAKKAADKAMRDELVREPWWQNVPVEEREALFNQMTGNLAVVPQKPGLSRKAQVRKAREQSIQQRMAEEQQPPIELGTETPQPVEQPTPKKQTLKDALDGNPWITINLDSPRARRNIVTNIIEIKNALRADPNHKNASEGVAALNSISDYLANSDEFVGREALVDQVDKSLKVIEDARAAAKDPDARMDAIEGMTELRKDRKPKRRKSKIEAKAEQIIEEGRGKAQARLDLGIDPVRTAAILTKGAFVAMRGAKSFANFSREMGKAYAKDWNALTGRQKRQVHRAAQDPKVQYEEALKKLPEKYRNLVGDKAPETPVDFVSRMETTGQAVTESQRSALSVLWSKMMPSRRVLSSRISPEFGHNVREFTDSFRQAQVDQQVYGRFADSVYAKLSKVDVGLVKVLDAAMRDGDSKQIREMAETYGFLDDYVAARKKLDEQYQRALDEGMSVNDVTKLRVRDKDTGKMVVVSGDQVTLAEKHKAAEEGRLVYEYWPRSVRDYKLLKSKIDELRGKDPKAYSDLDVAIDKENQARYEKALEAEDKRRAEAGLSEATKDEKDAIRDASKMNDAQEADFLTRLIQGYGTDRLKMTSDNFFSKRTFEKVQEELQPFYNDSFSSIENFSFRLNETIAKRKLLGIKGDEDVTTALERSADSIGAVLQKMRKEGTADSKTVGLVKDVLESMVTNKSTDPIVSVYRDVTTMALLGNLCSAALNIAEISMAILRHLGSGNPITVAKELAQVAWGIAGFETQRLFEMSGKFMTAATGGAGRDPLSAAAAATIGKAWRGAGLPNLGWEYYANRNILPISLDDLGVDSDAQSHILDSHYGRPGGKKAKAVRQATDVVMTAAGFKLLDRVARLSQANLTHKAMQRQAEAFVKTGNKDKLSVSFQRALNNTFGGERQKKLIKDLADGKHSVEVAMFIGELSSEMAPRNRIDMPVNYDAWGSYGKLSYQMLSFMLNRLSLFRETMSGRGLTGKKKVYSRLQSLQLMGLAFATEGFALLVQDIMLDREEEWDEKLVNVFFRTFGLSRYVVQQVQRGSLLSAATTVLPVAPVLAIPDALLADTKTATAKMSNPKEELKLEDVRSLFMVPVVGRIMESRRAGVGGRGQRLANEKQERYEKIPQYDWLGNHIEQSFPMQIWDELTDIVPVWKPNKYGGPRPILRKVSRTDRRGNKVEYEMNPQEYQTALKRVGDITRSYLGADAVYDEDNDWHKDVTKYARDVARQEFLRQKGFREPRARRPRRRGR